MNKQEKALRNIIEVIEGAKLVRKLSFTEAAILIEAKEGISATCREFVVRNFSLLKNLIKWS